MATRVTCVRALLWPGSHQPALRNAVALVVTRGRSTAAAQAVQDEWTAARPFEEIPGPKPLPLLGNAWRFLPVIGDLSGIRDVKFHKVLHERYGSIMKLTNIPGRNDLVILFDPDDIEKVFRNEGPWPIRESVQSAVYYRTVTRKNIFQGVGGLVVFHGEEWQKFRSKVNQTMMQPRSTKLYVGPIDAVANDFIERIRKIRDHNQEMPADFNNEMYKWGLESIVYIALDTRLGCFAEGLTPDSEPQKMINAVQVQFDAMDKMEMKVPLWRYVSTPTWRGFVKASDYFLEVSMKYINEAMLRLKSLPEDTDRELTVLEKILARDPDPRTAMVMALDMMGAGIDTTAYSAVIALYYLSQNPDKQQKLFEEIRTYLPDKNQVVTSDILNELKYLKACIKESMRISPIAVGNMRRLVKDLVLSNYRVPKGTDTMMPLHHLSNLDKYYPQADKFIPERWLKDGPYSNTKMHSFVTLPFGFGPRMCVGRRFAELEIETLLAKIIRNFHVEYNYKMEFKSKLVLTPMSPLKFKMVDRDN